MTSFGPSISQSVAGVDGAERVASREGPARKRSGPITPPAGDEADTAALSPEALDPARRSAGSDGEESTLDRRKRERQAPKGQGEKPEAAHIDIEG